MTFLYKSLILGHLSWPYSCSPFSLFFSKYNCHTKVSQFRSSTRANKNYHKKLSYKNCSCRRDFIKHLPATINRRISSLSCNEEEFQKARSGPYRAALKASSYAANLRYEQQGDNINSTSRRKKQSRKII